MPKRDSATASSAGASEGSTAQLADRVPSEILETALDRVGEYLLPGTTVALVAASDDFLQEATLTSKWRRPSDASDLADAAVVLGTGVTAETISASVLAVGPSLHPEGLAVLVLTSPPVDSSTRIAEAMWRVGFELVEWERTTGGGFQATLLFVRPIRSGRGAPELP